MSDVAHICRVQIWAKGFRITHRSEEYQLIVPNNFDALDPEERGLTGVDWGPVLRDLYRIGEDACAQQFLIGLSATSISITVVRLSRDRNDRPSIIGFAGTVPIDWERASLAMLVSQSAHLMKRLAQQLAEPLRRSPEHVRNQLREGTFLPNREFDLSGEAVDDEVDWTPICRQVQRWSGIRGIATPHLAGLGANVLVGTRLDADRVPDMAAIINLSTGELERLTDDLRLWAPPSVPIPAQTERRDCVDEIHETLKEIRDDQRRILNEQRRHYSMIQSFLESAWERLFALGGRPKKK